MRSERGTFIAFYNCGNHFMDIRQYSHAIQDYDQTARIYANERNVYMNRSKAKEAIGDKIGAQADSNKVAELLMR